MLHFWLRNAVRSDLGFYHFCLLTLDFWTWTNNEKFQICTQLISSYDKPSQTTKGRNLIWTVNTLINEGPGLVYWSIITKLGLRAYLGLDAFFHILIRPSSRPVNKDMYYACTLVLSGVNVMTSLVLNIRGFSRDDLMLKVMLSYIL